MPVVNARSRQTEPVINFVGLDTASLDGFPDAVQKFAWALPLTPATALVRGLVAGEFSVWMVAWLAEVVAYLVVALWLASRLMRRRLIK